MHAVLQPCCFISNLSSWCYLFTQRHGGRRLQSSGAIVYALVRRKLGLDKERHWPETIRLKGAVLSLMSRKW
jgi:hypothetical protein